MRPTSDGGDLLLGEALQNISGLEGIEAFDTHPAFEPLADFTCVILLVSERGDIPLEDRFSSTHHADARVSAKLSLCDDASGDVSQLRDTEYGSDLCLPEDDPPGLRLKHPLYC